jgi:hypothetical protein
MKLIFATLFIVWAAAARAQPSACHRLFHGTRARTSPLSGSRLGAACRHTSSQRAAGVNPTIAICHE